MDNPLSDDPRRALWTQPVGCTGHRLWQMATARTGISESDWLERTQRMNLCVGGWSKRAAIEKMQEIRPSLTDRTCIMLGREVAWTFGMDQDFLHWTPHMHDWVAIPHPSGLNHWYNCDGQRAAVEILLADILEEL